MLILFYQYDKFNAFYETISNVHWEISAINNLGEQQAGVLFIIQKKQIIIYIFYKQ